MKLSILGPTKLRKDDGSFENSFLKGSKRLALFTYLVLAKPRGFHRRDQLLALFWPERGQKSARNALNNMMYQIRHSLGKEILISRGSDEISINHEKVGCDAIEFEQLLNDGKVQKALDLYRGELLFGFHVSDISNDFQNWLDAERERLRNLAADGAWTLAENAEESGNHSDARKWAKKAADFTPFSEDAQLKLMTLLKRLGYRTDALKAYEKYKNRLQSEWDMEPSNKLKSLLENMNTESGGDTHVSKKDSEKIASSAVSKSNSNNSSLTSSNPTTRSIWLAAAALIVFVFISLGIFWFDRSDENEAESVNNRKSVAVLPFTYLSSEDSTDYFSIGMTEEILTRLAQFKDLSVISRTSVMQYRNSDKSIRQIGEELGVNTVVEGSVQPVGNEVRITAQLIDAQTDRHLWAESYNRPMKNILALQSEVAANIAQALQAELLPVQRAILTYQQDINEEAYHFYLQAQHLLTIREPRGIVEAPALFREAIRLDSTFAPAYGGLAMATIWSGLINRFDHDVTQVEGIPRAKALNDALESANQALRIDSTVVEAYLARAIVYELKFRDWDQSSMAFQNALSINPNHSEALSEYGWHLLRLGEISQGLQQMEKAVKIDPLSWSVHHGLGYAYYCDREYEKAIQQLETAINLGSLYPNTKKYLSTARFKLSQQLLQYGQDSEAWELIEDASIMLEEMWGENTGWREPLEHAIMGQGNETLQTLNNVELPFAPRLYMLLLVGQTKPTLEMIERGINFHFRVFSDPIFDSVRQEQRFKEIAEQKLQIELDL